MDMFKSTNELTGQSDFIAARSLAARKIERMFMFTWPHNPGGNVWPLTMTAFVGLDQDDLSAAVMALVL